MSRFANDLDLLKEVRFFYNGVKVNGERKIQKMSYTWWGDGEISVHREYLQDCAADLLICYKDVGFNLIQKDNPLYPYICNAALQSNIYCEKKELERLKKRILKLSEYVKQPISQKGSIESFSLLRDYEQKRKVLKWRIEEYESKLFKDIKNPDEKVLEAYKDYMKQKYQAFMAEKEKERERKEKERQEQILKVYKRKEGYKKYAEKLNELYPIRENEYYVEFEFSESPAIDKGMRMSLRAADKYLGYLDEEQITNRDNGECGWGWCDKTNFKIINEKGEIKFEDRFDIGDGNLYRGKFGLKKYGLVMHVMGFAESVRRNPESKYNLEEAENLAQKLYDICYGAEVKILGNTMMPC